MLLAAQCHLGSKNLQTHMEPYLWKLRPDGVHVLNIGKTWYVEETEKEQDWKLGDFERGILTRRKQITGRRLSWLPVSSPPLTTPPTSV